MNDTEADVSQLHFTHFKCSLVSGLCPLYNCSFCVCVCGGVGSYLLLLMLHFVHFLASLTSLSSVIICHGERATSLEKKKEQTRDYRYVDTGLKRGM